MIAIPIAQSLFLSALREQLSQRVPSLNPDLIVAAGPTALPSLAHGSQDVLTDIRL